MYLVYISQIAPYNEYDHACNGGYYMCPNPQCQHQLYISETYANKIGVCHVCNREHKFIYNF